MNAAVLPMGNMKIRRIIYLFEEPLNARDHLRFGVGIWKDLGFDIEVWDLSLIAHPELPRGLSPVGGEVTEKVTVFKDASDMRANLSTLTGRDLVINFLTFDHWNLEAYRSLSCSCASYVVQHANAVPDMSYKPCDRVGIQGFFRKLTKLFERRTWKLLLLRLPRQLLGVRPPRLLLAGGEKSIESQYFPVDRNTEILRLHTFDYDIYLKERGLAVQAQDIAVFLDEFLPYHSDYAFVGEKNPVEPQHYYDLLNTFFTKVERETGLKVVIAAHPRSVYETMGDHFNGRSCVKGQTAALVRRSRMVLSHASTALCFAILFEKPVVFISFSGVEDLWEGAYTKVMAEHFGKKPLYMDRPGDIDWDFERTINADLYARYKQLYIKTADSAEVPIWQGVADRVKRGF